MLPIVYDKLIDILAKAVIIYHVSCKDDHLTHCSQRVEYIRLHLLNSIYDRLSRPEININIIFKKS